LPDRLETGYARGFAFTSDKGGFYYCHEMSMASEDHTICLHRFEKPVVDQTVFRTARSRGSRLVLIADSIHLGAIRIHQQNSEFVSDFFIAHRDEPSVWKQVFVNRSLPYSPMLKYGRIFAISYEDAPNGKLVELKDNGCEVRTIVPEQDATIQQLVIAEDQIFVSYLRQTVPTIEHWSLSGKALRRVDIPTDGTIRLLPHPSETPGSIFYTHESFNQPLVTFEYLPDEERSQLWHHRFAPAAPASSSMRRVQYPSRDRTQIPMMLVSRRKSGSETEAAPVVMTGYGGFGIAMTPQFSVLVSIMMELGAVFALPQIRGGGEFGKVWHDAARGRNRQIAFDDFIAAAEWLCDERLTSPQQLAIFGGSNSGLLAGAAMTQRPDLLCAVLCIAPLLDMVRYEHFDQAAKWQQEYGTVESLEEFEALYAYSPYHHVDGTINYPATLFVAGDRDDRCNPAHARKMAARLQQRAAQTRPVLVDYSPERGHSPVLPLSVRTEALVRRIAFLCRELKISIPTAGGPDEKPCS